MLATKEPEHREVLEEQLDGSEQHGWAKLVAAIRSVVSGDRDADALCAALDAEDSMIIETIVAALADPSTLEGLLPLDGQGS